MESEAQDMSLYPIHVRVETERLCTGHGMGDSLASTANVKEGGSQTGCVC
jgi:hypothetical protein